MGHDGSMRYLVPAPRPDWGLPMPMPGAPVPPPLDARAVSDLRSWESVYAYDGEIAAELIARRERQDAARKAAFFGRLFGDGPPI